MRLVTVILHYGPVSRTQELYKQLLASDPEQRDSILVFDNASPEAYPGAWLRMDQNLYWAGAFEHTMQLLASQGATHVWFLNNDARFLTAAPLVNRAIFRLTRAERLLGPIGIYSPAVTMNPYHPQMIARRDRQFRKVRYVDGIAPLVSVQYWRECGGIDYQGNPYGYGVDVWFSCRAQDVGYFCVVDHQMVIRHRYHSSARELEGFMAVAAKAEDAFLRARLGADYKRVMAHLAADCREFG